MHRLVITSNFPFTSCINSSCTFNIFITILVQAKQIVQYVILPMAFFVELVLRLGTVKVSRSLQNSYLSSDNIGRKFWKEAKFVHVITK